MQRETNIDVLAAFVRRCSFDPFQRYVHSKERVCSYMVEDLISLIRKLRLHNGRMPRNSKPRVISYNEATSAWSGSLGEVNVRDTINERLEPYQLAFTMKPLPRTRYQFQKTVFLRRGNG